MKLARHGRVFPEKHDRLQVASRFRNDFREWRSYSHKPFAPLMTTQGRSTISYQGQTIQLDGPIWIGVLASRVPFQQPAGQNQTQWEDSSVTNRRRSFKRASVTIQIIKWGGYPQIIKRAPQIHLLVPVESFPCSVDHCSSRSFHQHSPDARGRQSGPSLERADPVWRQHDRSRFLSAHSGPPGGYIGTTRCAAHLCQHHVKYLVRDKSRDASELCGPLGRIFVN